MDATPTSTVSSTKSLDTSRKERRILCAILSAVGLPFALFTAAALALVVRSAIIDRGFHTLNGAFTTLAFSAAVALYGYFAYRGVRFASYKQSVFAAAVGVLSVAALLVLEHFRG